MTPVAHRYETKPPEKTYPLSGSPALAEMVFLCGSGPRLPGLVCPLCYRVATATCTLCAACLCPIHDVARRVAQNTICGACWREI